MEELLSLKWNNHRSTFLHILGVLRDKQAYTDVTLACDGKFYSVHKLVLSTCSDYFCAMFDKTACKSPVIVLKDIKCEDLEALLDYMYLGEVNVRQSDLASLIKAAENLRIKGLAVPDDEPPKKAPAPSRPDISRREGGSGSPPSKRKRRDEGEDGRDDVRPPPSGLHTPPPQPMRPKSPVSQRLSPSPHRTSDSHAAEDRDSRPLSSPAVSPATSHTTTTITQSSSQQLSQVSQQQSSHQAPHQVGDPQVSQQQNVSNQYRGEETPTFVKVEMEDEDTGDLNRESYDISGDGYKEEDSGDLAGADLSNDLPEFLQQAASSALATTSTTYPPSFAGPSGFQPEVSAWQGDSQSLPGSFTGLNFPPSSQDNPPGIGAELLGNVCKVCGKVFNGRNWKQNLEYHFLTHTKQKPYKCPICPHCSALKYNLIRHIRNRHSDLLFQSQADERGGGGGAGGSGGGGGGAGGGGGGSNSNLPGSGNTTPGSVAHSSQKMPASNQGSQISYNREILLPSSMEPRVPSNPEAQILSHREGAQMPLQEEVQMSHREGAQMLSHREFQNPYKDVQIPVGRDLQMAMNREEQLLSINRNTQLQASQEIQLSLNNGSEISNQNKLMLPKQEDPM